jgi:hypothetical protein
MTPETIGYFEEFFVNQKFIGAKLTEKQDREIGYYGKQIKIADTEIVLDNKKKIKKGQEYYTRYYPLNGKQQ